MKFSIDINRGSILEVIKLAEKNKLIINSIYQGPINDDMINIKIDFSSRSKVEDIENFIEMILDCHYLNSYQRI